ncbi:MAG: hypothetical protein ABL917_02215 [Parcubacteria group bacterium]
MGKKYLNPHHHITPWVAMVIISAIGATFGYFIWTNANESWGYEYVYPEFNKKVTNFLTKTQTVGWKTYHDEGYGFQLNHPAKYSATVGNIVASSALGPIPGTSVGPLIFTKVDTASMRQLANEKFNTFWNYRSRQESPKDYCDKGVIQNTSIDIRIASCTKNGTKSNYALIKGKYYDIFVDGSTSGYDKNLLDTYKSAGTAVSQTEFVQIISTLKLI